MGNKNKGKECVVCSEKFGRNDKVKYMETEEGETLWYHADHMMIEAIELLADPFKDDEDPEMVV